MADRQEIIDVALAIRGARSVKDHLSNVDDATRLALNQSQQRQFEAQQVQFTELQALRDEMMESQLKFVDMQQSLTSQLGKLIEFLTDRLSEPLAVNVPRAEVTMEQQPVTVNVPPTSVTMKPTIKIPEAQVIVQESSFPRLVLIKHSDGTTSKIELKN